MIKDRKPIAKRVTPKPSGSHLTPIAKDVKARQNTSGRTVGSDGKFSGDPEGVPAGIAEPKRNLKPKATGSQKVPQARWVTSKVDRGPQQPSRITEKHSAKRVI